MLTKEVLLGLSCNLDTKTDLPNDTISFCEDKLGIQSKNATA
jgi:hypothetical protein